MARGPFLPVFFANMAQRNMLPLIWMAVLNGSKPHKTTNPMEVKTRALLRDSHHKRVHRGLQLDWTRSGRDDAAGRKRAMIQLVWCCLLWPTASFKNDCLHFQSLMFFLNVTLTFTHWVVSSISPGLELGLASIKKVL